MTGFDKSRYKVKRLFPDEHFENGFHLLRVQNGKDGFIPIGKWQYPTSKEEPKWMIAQWYSKCCLAGERKDVGDPYVLTDIEDTKKVVYNPEENSLTMTMNARNIYLGGTKVEKYWPHLLIEQRDWFDFEKLDSNEKKFYSATADRFVVEYDMRILDYSPTTNPEGVNKCQFVAFAYLQLVGKNYVYFGYSPFSDTGRVYHFWNKAGGENNMIYALSTEEIFGSLEESFCTPPDKKVVVSQEWKHIEVDLTPYIDDIIDVANRDNIFARQVSKEEFYFSGTNMGFEVHGNINCTVEIKNYNLVSYIKKEK